MSLNHKDIKIATEMQGESKNCSCDPPPAKVSELKQHMEEECSVILETLLFKTHRASIRDDCNSIELWTFKFTIY